MGLIKLLKSIVDTTPKKKSRHTNRKSPARKTGGRKRVAKKSAATKKSAVKKSAVKKTKTKKPTANNSTARKTAARKSVSKNAAQKKAAAKESAVKKRAQKKIESVGVVPKTSFICIDGNNVIGVDESLRTKTLKAIVDALMDAGYTRLKVIVDGSVFGWLKYVVHDKAGVDYLNSGIKAGYIASAPYKTEADDTILQLFEFEKDVHIIRGTEHYRQYLIKHPSLKKEFATRIHGTTIYRLGNGKVRITVSGFKLDISLQE